MPRSLGRAGRQELQNHDPLRLRVVSNVPGVSKLGSGSQDPRSHPKLCDLPI